MIVILHTWQGFCTTFTLTAMLLPCGLLVYVDQVQWETSINCPSSPPLIGSIRRSFSCPRSISSQSPSSADIRPLSAQQMMSASRPTSASRSHSLNRASSYMRHVPHGNDASSTNSQMVSHLLCSFWGYGKHWTEELGGKRISWEEDRLNLRSFPSFSSWSPRVWIVPSI